MVVDTTKGKNLYNLPLAYIVGMNAENETENWVTGLLPTEKQEDFYWMVETLQVFIGTTLQAVNAVISDGSNELTNSLDYAISKGIFNTSTRRLLCYFHTITQHMNKHIKFVGPDIIKVGILVFLFKWLFLTFFV